MSKHYKISLIFHSYDVLYEYQKKNENSFWDVVTDNLKKTHKDWKIDLRLLGTTRAEVKIEADKIISHDDVKNYLSQYIKDTREYIVVITELPSEDNKNAEESDKASSGSSANNARGSFEDLLRMAINRGKESAGLDSAPEPDGQNGGRTIYDEAKKLEELKETLLKRVLGQRHAINEFAEAVFECDGFAKNDRDRKGPVATLLFTGPSGVGKTFLANQAGPLLNRKPFILDMSEFSDSFAYNRLNGEAGYRSALIDFIKAEPNGIVVFDEIEKAHLTTIHLLLQILDEGHLKGTVSFKDAIVILTTNAGSALYEDPTVYDLSATPKRVILDALRAERNPLMGNPTFPECITTRFANGHVVLFNHLEPYALMGIVGLELTKQIEQFKETYKINVSCDIAKMAAMILYCNGGTADARTLKGNARQMIIRELQEIVMQLYKRDGDRINQLKNINIVIDTDTDDDEVKALFETKDKFKAVVLADSMVAARLKGISPADTSFEFFDNISEFKERCRGIIDFAVIDPFCNMQAMDRMPNDIEDIESDGMESFRYMKKYFADVPIYILDARNKGEAAYETLISQGCRGIVPFDSEYTENTEAQLADLTAAAIANNNAFRLGRSGKILTYNCSQYTVDDSTAEIVFSRLEMKTATLASDKKMMVNVSAHGVKFDDVIGCKKAKSILKEFCEIAKNPRQALSKGKKIPKGVLLYGPPGTGKTMLAKAMANESGIPFFQATATSFFNMYVGQTEQNIRDIFAKARRYAPSVLFIDEVDAIAKNRTGTAATNHNNDALTTFLAEMDGFVTDEKRPVFIIAATNYDISQSSDRSLDAAFVRRFNDRIYVDLPDLDDRKELIKKELNDGGVDFGKNSDAVIKNVAERSAGLSNADLHNVIEAFLKKCGCGKPEVSLLMDSLDEFRFGEVNSIDEEQLRQTAYHEAGHALINKLMGYTPAFLTIVSRGNFGGFMEHSQDEQKDSNTFTRILNRVCCSLAGRAAEITVYGKEEGMNSGASQDIKTAREYIRRALDDYAMGDKLYISDVKDYTDEAEKLMKAQFDRAVKLLTEYRAVLDGLTDLLVAERNLDKTKLQEFFEAHNI